MPLFETPRREPPGPRREQDPPVTPLSSVDGQEPPHLHANLGRGIVWADILAEIAADEDARRLRDAA